MRVSRCAVFEVCVVCWCSMVKCVGMVLGVVAVVMAGVCSWFGSLFWVCVSVWFLVVRAVVVL